MKAKTQRVHLIAIGGNILSHLATALHQKGYSVSGSDDRIEAPSRARLEKAGLFLDKTGWFPEQITSDLDAVIVGTGVREDNPEVVKAKELGLKIYSFPEYIYEESKDKHRIVITGSHGKTMITAIIVHVLHFFKRRFDYVIGVPPKGFDLKIRLQDDAPVIIIEGDECLSSAIDKTPKFLHYRHHFALMSGIAWDHINVYPTFDEYVKQFELLADSTPKGGALIYSEKDDMASVICRKEREDVQRIEYSAHKNETENNQTFLIHDFVKIPVHIFGKHNMKNISGAKAVCLKLGVTEDMFYEAIQSFKGIDERLEIIGESAAVKVLKDFAHSPSKLKAATKAVKNQFPGQELVTVFELYTYSSLNKEFLGCYKDTFKFSDEPIVFFDPQRVENKKLPALTVEDVKKAFHHPKLQVFTDKEALKDFLLGKTWKNKNLLLMSSGNFGGTDVKELAKTIVEQ